MLSPLALKAIGTVAVVVGIGVMIAGYGYSQYRKGKEEGIVVAAMWENKYNEAVARHKADVNTWTEQVKAFKLELQRIEESNKKSVQKQVETYRERIKRLLEERKYAEIKPDAVVTAPDGVRLQYNHAVEGSRIATGQPSSSPSGDPPRATGATETFTADAYAEILVHNLNEYNKLAARCDALIQIIEDAKRGVYTYRIEGAPLPMR